MADILFLDQIEPSDLSLVGGKALGLATMLRAGLPVPPGFCITTSALGHLADPALRLEIEAAYQRMDGGVVAVRSSALAEDGVSDSFAGQQLSVLGVRTKDDLLKAIERCAGSLHSETAAAYRQQRGLAPSEMAVIVQRMVVAEVAGVLFTRDPFDVTGRSLLIEAAWGLGESVVSGRVSPDRFRMEIGSHLLLEREIQQKPTMRTPEGTCDVPLAKQGIACLGDYQLAMLAHLSSRVEELFGGARDVEFAWADGQCWLLQARPITTTSAQEREQVRQDEIAALTARAEPGGTVWARYNLSEVLPEPTPMTWAILRRLLSGQGGYGLMYRDLGFDPDSSLDQEGAFDLICGRPYCNLSREARWHFKQLPFEHSFQALKKNPERAMYPQPMINPANAGWPFWLLLPVRLPALILKLVRADLRRQRLVQGFPEKFLRETVPSFLAEVKREARLDSFSSAQLLERLNYWIKRTLVDFARESLKPAALGGYLMGKLERRLARLIGPERTRAAMPDILAGSRMTQETDLASGLRDLIAGKLARQDFLQRFGHRATGEMELAHPRWNEDVSSLDQWMKCSTSEREIGTEDAWPRLAASWNLSDRDESALRNELDTLRGFVGLRETAKHYLMAGYQMIRRILVELDHRFQLGGRVFYLTLDELPRLLAGEDLSRDVAQARRRRRLALTLEVPPVLFSDDLDAIGRPSTASAAEQVKGVAVSAGVAEGPALVMREPRAIADAEGFILVCPSTDPAWTPLFAQARGLVMETGGVLSHGAIVAREFGLPAVTGVTQATGRFANGQWLRVDGNVGTVCVTEEGGRMMDEGGRKQAD